jgi:hypothetical protein
LAAYITDSLAIRQILDDLDSARPSRLPQIRAVLSVPVDDEGREIETQPA